MIFLADPVTSASPIDCPNGQDYSPCECFPPVSERLDQIECRNISLQDISGIFRRTTPADFDHFSLSLSPAEPSEIIPADLLNNHRVGGISINCPSNDVYLRVDSKAFRSSIDTASSIYFSNCDMSRLDFQFLAGFFQIIDINFREMSNFGLANWASLPIFPSLNEIYIQRSTGLNEWMTLPPLAKGLNFLNLYGNDIQDEAMDRILNWTLQYSADTLQYLYLSENDMTRIPRQQFVQFQNLYMLQIQNQTRGIPFIPSDSFYSAERQNFYFTAVNNGIEKIEQGAFQGINKQFYGEKNISKHSLEFI